MDRKIFPSPDSQYYPPSSQKFVFLFPLSPPPPLPPTTVDSSDPLPFFLTCAIVFVIALICISFIVIFVLLPLFNHNNIIPGNDTSIMDISIGSDHHSTVEENVDIGGVDPSLIRALPEFEYELGNKGSVNCAICLSEFECKEVVKKIPFCGHVFHPKCIEMWLLDHPSCPLCRSAKLFIPQPVHHTFNGLALLKGWLRLS